MLNESSTVHLVLVFCVFIAVAVMVRGCHGIGRPEMLRNKDLQVSSPLAPKCPVTCHCRNIDWFNYDIVHVLVPLLFDRHTEIFYLSIVSRG